MVVLLGRRHWYFHIYFSLKRSGSSLYSIYYYYYYFFLLDNRIRVHCKNVLLQQWRVNSVQDFRRRLKVAVKIWKTRIYLLLVVDLRICNARIRLFCSLPHPHRVKSVPDYWTNFFRGHSLRKTVRMKRGFIVFHYRFLYIVNQQLSYTTQLIELERDVFRLHE